MEFSAVLFNQRGQRGCIRECRLIGNSTIGANNTLELCNYAEHNAESFAHRDRIQLVAFYSLECNRVRVFVTGHWILDIAAELFLLGRVAVREELLFFFFCFL